MSRSKAKKPKSKESTPASSQTLPAPPWSDWQWDEEGQFYYRARKSANDVWQYEFAEISVAPAPAKQEAPQYSSTPLELTKEEQKALYAPKKSKCTYEVPKMENGEYVLVPVCEELEILETGIGSMAQVVSSPIAVVGKKDEKPAEKKVDGAASTVKPKAEEKESKVKKREKHYEKKDVKYMAFREHRK